MINRSAASLAELDQLSDHRGHGRDHGSEKLHDGGDDALSASESLVVAPLKARTTSSRDGIPGVMSPSVKVALSSRTTSSRRRLVGSAETAATERKMRRTAVELRVAEECGGE